MLMDGYPEHVIEFVCGPDGSDLPDAQQLTLVEITAW